MIPQPSGICCAAWDSGRTLSKRWPKRHGNWPAGRRNSMAHHRVRPHVLPAHPAGCGRCAAGRKGSGHPSGKGNLAAAKDSQSPCGRGPLQVDQRISASGNSGKAGGLARHGHRESPIDYTQKGKCRGRGSRGVAEPKRVGGRSPITRKMCDLFFATSSPLRPCACARFHSGI